MKPTHPPTHPKKFHRFETFSLFPWSSRYIYNIYYIYRVIMSNCILWFLSDGHKKKQMSPIRLNEIWIILKSRPWSLFLPKPALKKTLIWLLVCKHQWLFLLHIESCPTLPFQKLLKNDSKLEVHNQWRFAQLLYREYQVFFYSEFLLF